MDDQQQAPKGKYGSKRESQIVVVRPKLVAKTLNNEGKYYVV